MTTSFFNGISGLKSYQSGINIWGDNIANINTPGFKEKIPEFESLFSQTLSTSDITSDKGMGSVLTSSAMDLKEGSIVKTDNPFDLAISNEGWFKVKKNNQELFTRNGSFTKDRDGFLVSDSGAYLIGANANNITQKDNQFIIDPTIDTDNLIEKGNFSPIKLPSILTYPPKPTDEMKLEANLQDNLFEKAKDNINISALFDKNKSPIEMQENQSIAFTTGDITYQNGYFQKDICLANEDYDFFINGKEIKVNKSNSLDSLINNLKTQLDQNNINYSIKNNILTISDKNKLIIKSNLENISNASGEKLIYKDTPTNENEFNNLDTFTKKLNDLIDNKNIEVKVNNGKIEIKNNSDNDFINHFYQTDYSNELFFNNLLGITQKIPPKSSTQSAEFYDTYQKFGGFFIDENGEKKDINFTFTKKDILPDTTIWNGEIKIADNIINQDFQFDKKGNLISPKEIKISQPQNMTLQLGLTYFKAIKNSTNFTQNGETKGDLTNYQIDENGNIFALFSNSKSAKIATIPIYHFQNDQGLDSIGSNLYIPTSNSNEAFLYSKDGKYIPGSKILSNSIEQSNVNLSQAMTELIVTQKAFASAAKTVTTSDEMIKKAIDMKR